METLLCNFCNKKFINKYTLKTHIETSVKCISIRKKKDIKISNTISSNDIIFLFGFKAYVNIYHLK